MSSIPRAPQPQYLYFSTTKYTTVQIHQLLALRSLSICTLVLLSTQKYKYINSSRSAASVFVHNCVELYTGGWFVDCSTTKYKSTNVLRLQSARSFDNRALLFTPQAGSWTRVANSSRSAASTSAASAACTRQQPSSTTRRFATCSCLQV